MILRFVPALGLLLAASCGRDPCPGGACPGSGCDEAVLAERMTALRRARTDWSPTSGVVPDYGQMAASAIWHACPTLPGPMRVLLDLSVEHDFSATEPRTDALADVLPGHAPLDLRFNLFADERRALEPALCPNLYEIATSTPRRPDRAWRETMFARCDLGSRGFLDRQEMLDAAHYDPIGLFLLDLALLDRGVSPTLAREALRELAFSNREFRPRKEQRLTHGPVTADPLTFDTPELFIGPDKLHLDGYTILSLQDGAIPEDEMQQGFVHKLYDLWIDERPAPRTGDDDHLLVWIDRTVRWSTLFAVVFTARTSGFEAIDVAYLVPDGPYHVGVTRLSCAHHDKPPLLGVVLDPRGDSVFCDRQATPVQSDEELVAKVTSCPWFRFFSGDVHAAPAVPAARVEAARTLMAQNRPFGAAGPPVPPDDPSRVELRIHAHDATIGCNGTTTTLTTPEALAAEVARCHGPQSDSLDLQSDPDVPMQRIVEMAIAGRLAGKRVGVEESQ
ncbi:hypothetical protein [Nannocystis radixulma]|uniref:Lipoprotein n=1 Tax=Nannocystis radixulma TaxID=2995305 RepID=A0ABT5B7L7_9BACT|nr:hypothetical protein [Nannocystis radixulma]MDC0669082.1 hypothetical protein [Nannocystis radixulma]